ncbi:MAG: aldolase [Burkholderiaceae bacterium]
MRQPVAPVSSDYSAGDPRADLTHSAWILADEGHESGLAGQLTARGPKPGTYWTLPLGLAFDEVTPAAWLLIDAELNVLAGDGAFGVREPNPATRFHVWVYRARPDVNAVAHSHAPAASALAAAQRPLLIAHMDATPLFEDTSYLPRWLGLPTADREGEQVAAGLGDKHAMLLAHHGILTAGRTVQEANFLAVFMERMARQQLDAEKVGGAKPLDGQEARRARDFLRTDRIMNLTFDAWARRAQRRRAAVAA